MTTAPSMQDQQKAIAQITQLINKSSASLACDADCQKLAKAEKLKNRYETAQTAVHSAPHDYETSRKKYLTFTKGELYYEDVREKELTEKANLLGEKLATAFQSQADLTRSVGVAYDTDLVNAQNTAVLNDDLRRRAIALKSGAIKTQDVIMTNERKTWYESMGSSTMEWRYTVVRGIYLLSAIVFIVMYIVKTVKKSDDSVGMLIGKSIALSFVLSFVLLWWLPFSDFTLLWVMWEWLVRLKSILFPRQVYRGL